jgi:hypothetical protein
MARLDRDTGLPSQALQVGEEETEAHHVALSGGRAWITGLSNDPDYHPACSGTCSDVGSMGASDDTYLLALDAGGDCELYCVFSSLEHDRGLALAPDGSGGVFLGGRYEGSINFMSPLGEYGGTDGFLAHVDLSGTAVAARPLAGSADDAVLDIAVLGGEPIVAGTITSGAFLDKEGAAESPGYVAKLEDSMLAEEWHHYVGNARLAGVIRVVAVAASSQTVLTAGDFGGGDDAFTLDGVVRSAADRDVFVARMDAAGAVMDVATLAAATERAWLTTGVALTSDGEPVVVGAFDATLRASNGVLECATAPCGFVVGLGPPAGP